MDIQKALQAVLPSDRIKTRLIDLVSYASDAGFYTLQPKAVVLPENENEIIGLLQFSHRHKIPVTFRTGGTSLSGQSITDGILVDLSRYWRKILPENEGKTVRVQPGAIGAMVNAHLKKYSRKIGPDPSSINSAMMGGILSNNSSGMCCGVHHNSYHTLRSIKFILPNGNTFSTEIPTDYERFGNECAPLSTEIIFIKNEIENNRPLQQRIRKKYRTKNTVGYSLNAFIDFHHPLDIMAHLLVGAEGTLGFIAEAVMDTVADLPYKSTALLYFPDIFAACKAIGPLIEAGAEAVELMDRASLRSVQHIKGTPEIFKTLSDEAAALLVEFQDADEAKLAVKVLGFTSVCGALELLETPSFTRDAGQQAFLWKLRKGMFPAVGAVRASGTTVILEDIAFPVAQLGAAILDLQALFKKFSYSNAIIFGHAKDGNIHFVVSQSLNDPAEVQRYAAFMDEVVDLVVKKYDGTLKAEHGTGRNMAPFVETEWGGDAYRLMQRLKNAIDPENLLNPGVIINSDKKAHLKNMKLLPTVEEEVDKCIECGYCEHLCPSRELTMTPRRRIVARRTLAQWKQQEGMAQNYRLLLSQYGYDGLDTCAVDGMCATACPVHINTGDLVKRLRSEQHSAFANRIAQGIATHFAVAERLVKFSLASGEVANRVFGPSAMPHLTKGLKKVIPSFPLWLKGLHVPKATSSHSVKSGTNVVYFPTCISRMMGGNASGGNIIDIFMKVSAKVQIEVIMPEKMTGQCCGQAFSSKGYKAAAAVAVNRWVEQLWHVTQHGAYPVVADVTSCTFTLHHSRALLSPSNQEKFDRLQVIDSVDYLHDWVLPRAKKIAPKEKIALHPVCSLEKMGLKSKFIDVAQKMAGEVDVPLRSGCCGMAGDRGFLVPELTHTATAGEAADVAGKTYDGCYSTAKTCEIALSEATGRDYQSLLYLAYETIVE